MFALRSGLRFSSRALEVPKPRVRKRSFSLTKMTSSLLSKRRKSKTISDYKHTLISEKLFWKFKPFGTVTCPWGFDVFGVLVNKDNQDFQHNQDNPERLAHLWVNFWFISKASVSVTEKNWYHFWKIWSWKIVLASDSGNLVSEKMSRYGKI